jgi:CRP/FNR family cyclic AMP-dependent transcriptional regulator
MPKKQAKKRSGKETRSWVNRQMAQPRKAQSARAEFSQAERAPVAAKAPAPSVDWEALIAGVPPGGKSVLEYSTNRSIFMQGQPADSVFYIRKGKVKLSVTSAQGKEAIIATLEAGDFFGEGCLTGQLLRLSTAIALTECTVMRIGKPIMASMLHEQHGISELFVNHLLSRNIRFEGDLVDQLFNNSEKRLARILLLLSHFGKESKMETVMPGVSQETLAQMVGTTRSRVSHFMNRFKDLGFINYEHAGDLKIHSGLLSIVLHD